MSIAMPSLGFGLGLRKEHYESLLDGTPPVDWLEVLTENYLIDGGKPLHYLDRLRARYPLVLHGVGLSIGSTAPLDWDYLSAVRELAARVEPRWISDHLCWTGTGGINLHDLMPLPYTEESLAHVVARVRCVQDYFGRQILLENVSSYLDYAHSVVPEWEFLNAVAEQADCLLLLDVNNIYVSSRNHGFDAVTYLDALSHARIRQIHLAGHRDHGDHVIDTHDAAVADPVWALYRDALERYGPVATMIERDADIPPLAELTAELAIARRIADEVESVAAQARARFALRLSNDNAVFRAIEPAPGLATLQDALAAHVRDPACALPEVIVDGTLLTRERRAAIYIHGYRLRLIEALTDDFPALVALLGADAFAEMADGYIDANPSRHYSIRWFGRTLEHHIATTPRYRHQPLLVHMARFEWTLGLAFDAADADAVTFADLLQVSPEQWGELQFGQHPSVRHIRLGQQVPALWRQARNGDAVAVDSELGATAWWRLWRHELRTLFRSVTPLESAAARFLTRHSFGELCLHLGRRLSPDTVPAFAAGLVRNWIDEGSIATLGSTSTGATLPVADRAA